MRGDLNTYEIKCMYGESFDKCTGCSATIQEAYLADRAGFMVNACNDADFLEKTSGMAEMKANIDFDDVASFGSSDENIDIE